MKNLLIALVVASLAGCVFVIRDPGSAAPSPSPSASVTVR